ncbi:tRNA pseudouridine(38-40) synthase TruA, partial [bacterium]|nr:tRNA pseudouridine(38-40) synthase TruA [bacterium]
MRLLLSYDGSDFHGWQKQPEGQQTVQGVLESALSQILDEPIAVCGGGRTDKGVHALNQNAHFWTTKNPLNYNFTYALNGNITPYSLHIKKAWLAPDDFHALSSTHKTYQYVVLNRETPSPIKRNYSLHVKRPLNIDLLNEAAQCLIGEHDFTSFQTSGTESLTTIKKILQSQWRKTDKDTVIYTITGNGFLRQMVRNIVGTLLHIENKGLSASEIPRILAAKDRQKAYESAAPQGLYLTQVNYPKAL